MTHPIALPTNGVDVTTGDYLPSPSIADFANEAAAWLSENAEAGELSALSSPSSDREDHRGRWYGVDPLDLSDTGWGVVFATDADPAIRGALRPLLRYREEVASARSVGRYWELAESRGYRAGETKQAFLRRQGVAAGPVDPPDLMPSYLLLVGGPDEIPFEIQYQLGEQHAVGRISFSEVDAYRRYAENVVAAESLRHQNRPDGPTRLAFFAPHHVKDLPTKLSLEHLVSPLVEAFQEQRSTWDVSAVMAANATKDDLVSLITVPPPNVLIAAGHGVGLPAEDARQRRMQGALLCQDWAGPGYGPVNERCWFGADDVAQLDQTDLTGLITVLFASFSVGTTCHDGFRHYGAPAVRLADHSFVGALPQALLGREGGGLAAVGYVNRVWSWSFLTPGMGPETQVMQSMLTRLGAGQPIGNALEYVSDRYAELAGALKGVLMDIKFGRRVPDQTVAELRAACSDARSLTLLGDPAARALCVADRPTPARAPLRETIEIPARRVAPTELRKSAPPRAQEAPTRIVEVATYVADDPTSTGYDPAVGRISGAVPVALSHVHHDGRAAHVVRSATSRPGDPSSDPIDRVEREAVVELHARLLAVSLQRAAELADADGEDRPS